MADKELGAMAKVAEALGGFADDEAVIVERILRWANARYLGHDIENFDPADANRTRRQHNRADGDEHQSDDEPEFNDVADLYHAVTPKSDIDRALTVGYWFQCVENQIDFGSQQVNSVLKQLGHGVGNITVALGSLMKRSPSLIMQTAKKGKSKQARKRYKLTTAGTREIARRLKESHGAAPED